MEEKIIYIYKAKTAEQKMALQTLKDCHSFLEKKLGIETNLCLIKKRHKSTENIRGIYNPKDNVIVINLENLKGETIKESINVLAHEMRHAVQYKNNWISKFKVENNEGIGYWKGKKYNVGYWDSPWEKDARKYEEKYTKEAIDNLNLKRKSKIKI